MLAARAKSMNMIEQEFANEPDRVRLLQRNRVENWAYNSNNDNDVGANTARSGRQTCSDVGSDSASSKAYLVDHAGRFT